MVILLSPTAVFVIVKKEVIIKIYSITKHCDSYVAYHITRSVNNMFRKYESSGVGFRIIE